MKPQDLDLRDLLDFSPDGGVIRFGAQRVVLLDVAAFGLLRRSLVDTLGFTGARALLTQFGFSHGVATAESARSDFPWDTEREWQRAGGRLHTLKGLVTFAPVVRRRRGVAVPFADSVWRDSYEAEEHLAHHGRSDEPVCWTLVGFASGYLSRVNGRDILCVEERCVGMGDPVCRMVGKPREEWGPELDRHVPYFSEPCLKDAVARTLEDLKRSERRLRGPRRLRRLEVEGEQGLLARSVAMRQVLEVAQRAARVDSPVMLVGERGTGKERLARYIHERSSRVGGAFVPVRCEVDGGTLADELFGAKRETGRGAPWTAARGGTLYLESVDQLRPAEQARLSAVLEDRASSRGDGPGTPRLLSSVTRDPRRAVSEGRLRRDLYHRLRVIELELPPLRRRREDIVPLARMMLDERRAAGGAAVEGLTAAAGDQLARYDWPGNLAELAAAIERAAVLAEGRRIDVEDLPEEVRAAVESASFRPGTKSLAEVEREHILAVLKSVDGNRARAAARLGIGPATLYRKLKAYRRPARR